MDISTQAALLRAARAWVNQDRQAVADATGLHLNTLSIIERGERITGKSWRRLVDYYAGLVLMVDGDSRCLRPIE